MRAGNGSAIGVISCAFLLGALLDFLFGGVLKVAWAVVYVPVYVAIAGLLADKLLRTRFASLARLAAADGRAIPVTIRETTDYGCIRGFKVAAVAGVE